MKGKKGKVGLNLSGGFLLWERGRTDCLICRMKKEEFKKKGWNEEEETGKLSKTYVPDSIIVVDLGAKMGKAITYHRKYGKLELTFNPSVFNSVIDLEIFCIKYFVSIND
jgi:hypothetical protein